MECRNRTGYEEQGFRFGRHVSSFLRADYQFLRLKLSSTVATYQTLLQTERLAKFNPNDLKVVVVDEAHHAASPSYRYILSHFDSTIKNPKPDERVFPSDSRVPIVGFSATFSRHDGLALGAVFDRIVYHRDFVEMIKEQWSARCLFIPCLDC
jgi:ATP-dependent helicase IRC3